MSHHDYPVRPYGDLTALNTCRLVLDSVGREFLTEIVDDFLELLGTSAAVYESNGDYALGIICSDWCQLLDQASHALCGCSTNQDALSSGKWLCHESCWTDASRIAVQTGADVDVPCHGGLNIFAVPIWVHGHVVGSMNFGYGAPPQQRQMLEKLSRKYQLPLELLTEQAHAYSPRPDEIVGFAKKRLKTSARLVGTLIERAEVEHERESLISELASKNSELERFVYTASHDLRSPLITMRGFVGYIDRAIAAGNLDQARADLARVAGAVEKMRRLLDDLLQLSRIGTMNPKREAVPLEEVVDEAINNAALFLRERNIDVQTASDMPMVFAERMRLLEALQNLIDNAVKFMGTQPAPRIWIDCETEEHVCRVLVRDNGIGIDRRYTNKVFDLFEKLDPDSDGSGAGLAIVRRVIETHGGRIDVQSDGPGLGSVFHFTLPLARGANAAQGES